MKSPSKHQEIAVKTRLPAGGAGSTTSGRSARGASLAVAASRAHAPRLCVPRRSRRPSPVPSFPPSISPSSRRVPPPSGRTVSIFRLFFSIFFSIFFFCFFLFYILFLHISGASLLYPRLQRTPPGLGYACTALFVSSLSLSLSLRALRCLPSPARLLLLFFLSSSFFSSSRDASPGFQRIPRDGSLAFHVVRRRALHCPQGRRRLCALPQGQDKVRVRKRARAVQKLRKGHARVLFAVGEHGPSPRPEPSAPYRSPSPCARRFAGLRARCL